MRRDIFDPPDERPGARETVAVLVSGRGDQLAQPVQAGLARGLEAALGPPFLDLLQEEAQFGDLGNAECARDAPERG